MQPATILEVGVRYGYSAAAFLNASPNSKYVGIDLDSNDFGGVKGAMLWAQEITPGDFVLRLTLVQEGVLWFDASPVNVATDASIAVT